MGVEGCFKGRVKGVLWLLQGCFIGVSRVFHGCFKVLTREIKGGLRGCKMCFRSWSGVFQLCVEGVTRQVCIKGVTRVLEGYFVNFLRISN